MANESEWHVLKHFVVRHHPKYSRTWLPAGYFETSREAVEKFETLHQLHHDERVWVLDLMTAQVIADSNPPRRRR